MQFDQVNKAHIDLAKYRCAKCQRGKMIPSNPEGEPEYNDLFVCSHCQHQDHITAPAVLCSQAITSSLGIMFCIYLLLHQIESLAAAKAGATLDYALIVLCGVFGGGFGFVMSRAYRSFKHRRRYTALPSS